MSTQPRLSRAIVLDDDDQYLNLIKMVCESEGYETQGISDPHVFLQGKYIPTDLLILDLSLPGIDGIEVLRELAERHCHAQLILISGQDRSILRAAENLALALNLNYIQSLGKPVKISDLRSTLVKMNDTAIAKSSFQESTEWQPTLSDLRAAISNNQIRPFYQPQIQLSDGTLYGLEALARWHHPTRGMISPASFIPLAEESGLIVPMTYLLIEQTLKDLHTLNVSGMPELSLSVNISAAYLNDVHLPDFILKQIALSEVDPTHFTLEVTESGLMHELAASLEVLTRLRLKGFNLSIDDFGTGYSSMAQMQNIPFNELKIDQSFVKNLTERKESKTIVETCLHLSQQMELMSVAEGIEDEQTLMILKDMGCQFAQGFFIGKPMPIEEVMPWHDHWNNTRVSLYDAEGKFA